MQDSDTKDIRHSKIKHQRISLKENESMMKRPLLWLNHMSTVKTLLYFRYLTSFLTAFSEICFAWLLMQSVDAMILGDMKLVANNLTFIVFSIISIGLFTGFNSWLTGYITSKSGYMIRNNILKHYQEIDFIHTDGQEATLVQTLLTSAVKPVQDYFGRDLPSYVLYASKFTLAAILLYLMNWKLMVASMLVIPLFVWLSGKTGNPLEAKMNHLIEEQGKVNGLIKEIHQGLPVIKAFQLAEYSLNRFREAQLSFYHAASQLERKKAALQFFEIFLNYVPFILCFILGGIFAVEGTLTAGGLLALLQLVGLIAEPAAMLPVLFGRRKMASGAAGKILDFLFLPVEYIASDRDEKRDLQPDECVHDHPAGLFNPAMRLIDIDFYREEKNILSNINLTIEQNTITAIVGESGSGKTTLLHMIAGLIKPSSGSITMPAFTHTKKMISSSQRREWSALVTQNALLFPWSIRENLLIADAKAEFSDMKNVLTLAGAFEFVEKSPNGLDTVLAETGKGLSGGQSQRIAIARALLKKAPILLLDEPTSALDQVAEDDIVHLLTTLKRSTTIIMTTHRLMTCMMANQIVVLQSGRIVGVGTHDLLLSSCPAYQTLFVEWQKPIEVTHGKVV